MKRDLYIDYAKGLATLSVIFIHTTFWSGQLYVSKEMRVLSLLFDVPIFFALSGFTSSGNVDKTFYRLLKLQITYMVFVTGLFFFDSFFKVFLQNFFSEEVYRDFFLTFGSKYTLNTLGSPFDWRVLGNWWVHHYSTCDIFPVVMGSFWYLKIYYIITILGVLVLRFFSKYIDWVIAICVILTLIFNFVPNYYPTGQVGYTTFYLAVFLMAFRLKGRSLSPKQTFLSLVFVVVSYVAMFVYFGTDIFYLMNKQKFPPKIPYIVWSFLSLFLVFYFYNRLRIEKESLIAYIGKNAIFFYFAQGISSSLIYFMIPFFKDNVSWWVLMIFIFLINVLLAIFLANILKKIDQLSWRILEKLKKN